MNENARAYILPIIHSCRSKRLGEFTVPRVGSFIFVCTEQGCVDGKQHLGEQWVCGLILIQTFGSAADIRRTRRAEGLS
ncbi:hypothetical protein R1flu_022963 [Riccia fluitans]|uniref:Uncharacterized protein n=1 Tax=Riccia fluitans TaxID=41844 RepID=A0ABD1XQS3_9MARC